MELRWIAICAAAVGAISGVLIISSLEEDRRSSFRSRLAAGIAGLVAMVCVVRLLEEWQWFIESPDERPFQAWGWEPLAVTWFILLALAFWLLWPTGQWRDGRPYFSPADARRIKFRICFWSISVGVFTLIAYSAPLP